MIVLMILGLIFAIIILGFMTMMFISFIIYDKYNGDGYCTLIDDKCKHPDIECEDCIIADKYYRENENK